MKILILGGYGAFGGRLASDLLGGTNIVLGVNSSGFLFIGSILSPVKASYMSQPKEHNSQRY